MLAQLKNNLIKHGDFIHLYVLFFLSKMHSKKNYLQLLKAIEDYETFDKVLNMQNIVKTLYSLALMQNYSAPIWAKLMDQLLQLDTEKIRH